MSMCKHCDCDTSKYYEMSDQLIDANSKLDKAREALSEIKGMTDADDHESYRADDREGCLDTVQGLAAKTLDEIGRGA